MKFIESIIVGAGVYIGWTFMDIFYYAIKGDKIAKKFIRNIRKALDIEEDKSKNRNDRVIGFKAD